jgi:uncharacterized repeat protein (TIGR01451 family)
LMKKNRAWIKSLAVTIMVTALMGAAGFYFFTGTNDAPLNTSSMEATGFDTASVSFSAVVEKPSIEENKTAQNNTTTTEKEETTPVVTAAAAPPVDKKAVDTSIAAAPVASVSEPAPVQQTAAVSDQAPVQQTAAVSEPAAVEEQTEAPAAAPAAAEEVTVTSQPTVSAAPVTYSWGSSANYTFRMEVKVTNNGTDTAQNVVVSVPLLENSSPYQTTTLKAVNYDVISSSGRVSNFNLGDLAPGESKTIVADFAVKVSSVSIKSTNETVEKARKIYEKYAGSGNCRDLALGFINEARANGITAREVVGFARPQRGAMTSGSLQGSRHSWAEFYIDGLGWVPVDLTFQYFGAFPYTSHVVESYSDQSIKVNYTGGSLGASWSNSIL